MLDVELCKILGIDEFHQWFVKELDDLEDKLHSCDLSAIDYVKIKSRYDTLLEVRDKYCEFKNKNK